MKNHRANIHFTSVLLFFAMIISTSSCEKSKDEVIDRDGNKYKTVTIGTQTWMSENLKTTTYRNGDPIQNIQSDSNWEITTWGAYCDNENDINNGNIYGHLYNWYSVNDSRHLCPSGWHIPSHEEWLILRDYLGGEDVAGGKLKEVGTLHWLNPNTGATNESGFTALPGGGRGFNGTFYTLQYNGFWWSSSEEDSNRAIALMLLREDNRLMLVAIDKRSGFSIRCIKDK